MTNPDLVIKIYLPINTLYLIFEPGMTKKTILEEYMSSVICKQS